MVREGMEEQQAASGGLGKGNGVWIFGGAGR
jgi:hypothetical protein